MSLNVCSTRVFDYSTGTFSNPFPVNKNEILNSSIAYTIAEDSHHNIYAGTDNGIIQLTNNGVSKIAYTTKNGLPTNHNTNIFFDSYDNLWSAYDEDVYYKKPNASNFTSIRIQTGLPYGIDDWSHFEADKQNLYISLANQFAIVDLDKINHSLSEHAPLISGVSVFEKQIPFTIHHPKIDLKPDENFLTIDFSAQPGYNNAVAEYAYKLEDYDKDWVYCGKRQSAAYTNLPDGSYTFMVKCTRQKDDWDKAVTTISIYIAPPFYKSWWFILLIVLLTSLIAFWFYHLYKKGKQKKYVDRTIDYFANSVYGENSVNEICWDIARNCISQLAFEDCVVYLFDEQKNRLVQKAAYGPKNPKGHEIMNPIEIELGKGIVGTVGATIKPLLIADTTKEERYIVDDERRFSELVVPIIHDNKLLGVIDSEHSRKNYFTQDHLKALTTIASISANKIAEAIAEATSVANEMKLLEINKMLAESQLLALRAQMNPHFVFNCLNSIQECIVTQKYGEASKYLNKFSKLFRMVLNNSGKKLVTIEEEKEVLELYLELEQMRFEESFSYKMIMDEDLEEDILMPSMLLQPYVENALWHGLMHKQGERKLIIQFKRLNEDVFQCIISDNGIGRKRSFQLKEEQSKTKRHESKGLKISKDRLDVLNTQGEHAFVNIIDNHDDNGNASGTTVIIELSTYLKP